MDINRDLKKVSLWTKYRNWSIYHDLQLYQYSETDVIWVTLLTIINLLQKLSLIHIKFGDGAKHNAVHKWMYRTLNKSTRASDIFDENFKVITMIYGVYLFLKLIAFIYFYYVATKIKVLRDKSALTLRTIHLLNVIDLRLMFIPVSLMNWNNIFNESFYLKMISVEIIIVQVCVIFIELCLTYDFKFEKTALNQGSDLNRKIIEYSGIMFICMIEKMFGYEKEESKIFYNLLNIALALILLLDMQSKLHFISKPYIRNLNMISLLLYLTEACIGLSFVLVSDLSNGKIDIDYMVLVIFMLIYSVSQTMYKSKLNHLSTKHVYKLKTVQEADQYLENLAILFKNVNHKKNMLELFSILKLHYKHCDDMRCLCFLLKHRIS